MATLQEALVAALDHQEAGRFAKADILYRRLPKASPAIPMRFTCGASWRR